MCNSANTMIGAVQTKRGGKKKKSLPDSFLRLMEFFVYISSLKQGHISQVFSPSTCKVQLLRWALPAASAGGRAVPAFSDEPFKVQKYAFFVPNLIDFRFHRLEAHPSVLMATARPHA